MDWRGRVCMVTGAGTGVGPPGIAAGIDEANRERCTSQTLEGHYKS